jgi:hypothetical protein
MPATVPTLDAIITAVAAAIDAVNETFGTVLVADQPYDSELEFIEEYRIDSGGNEGKIDLWVVTSLAPEEFEGEAASENYCVYPILCRYWNIRVNDPIWEKNARLQVEAIRDALNKNSAIFRIGSQFQLIADETCSVEAQGFDEVEGEQRVYKAILKLEVEARRWT